MTRFDATTPDRNRAGSTPIEQAIIITGTDQGAFRGDLLPRGGHIADVSADPYGVYSPRFRPEDHYVITVPARLAALDTGVTAVLDWAHNMTAPRDEDAGIHPMSLSLHSPNNRRSHRRRAARASTDIAAWGTRPSKPWKPPGHT